MTLFDSLSKISEQIQDQRHLIKTEAATKQVSIRPFIHALGYNVNHLAEVEPEYTASVFSSGTDKVDYAIKRDGKPIILVEAKAVDIALNRNHWKQLYDYFAALDEAEFGILTNGVEYRLYTDLKRRNVMDEDPFLVINMDKLDPSRVNALEEFSKARFVPGENLRKIKISNLLHKELSQPSDEFVKHFAKQVHSGSLFQSKILEYRPLVKRAWDDLVDQEIARRLRRHDEEEKDTPAPSLDHEPEPVPPLPSGQVVEVPIFADYRGRRFEAIFLLRENVRSTRINVRYEGKVMASSRAGEMLKLSVDPQITGSTNGWTFWKFVDPGSNQVRLIDDFRKDPGLVRRLMSGE